MIRMNSPEDWISKDYQMGMEVDRLANYLKLYKTPENLNELMHSVGQVVLGPAPDFVGDTLDLD